MDFNQLYLYLYIFLFLSISYLVWMKLVRKNSWDELITKTKVYFVLILFFIGTALIVYHIIEFELVAEADNSNFLYTIIISMMLGIYINILGITMGMKSSWKAAMLIALIFFSFSGFGYLGIRIRINIAYLVVKTFESNAYQGVWFLIGNYIVFALIMILSYGAEGETKE